MKLKDQECPHLNNIVSFDLFPESQREKAKAVGINLYHYNEILRSGETHPDIIL